MSLVCKIPRAPLVSSSPIDGARILIPAISSKKTERVADQGRPSTTVDVRMSPPECNRHIGRQGAIEPRGRPPSFRKAVACSTHRSSARKAIVLSTRTDLVQIAPLSFPLNARLLSALLLHVLVVEDDQLRRVEAREDQLVAIGHDVEPDHDIGHRITEAVDIVVIVLF